MAINLDYPDTRLKITCGLTTLLTVSFEKAQRWWKDAIERQIPHRPSPEVELADLIIRVADYAQAFNYDLAGAVLEKLDFNRTRLDHTYKARQEPGGKKF